MEEIFFWQLKDDYNLENTRIYDKIVEHRLKSNADKITYSFDLVGEKRMMINIYEMLLPEGIYEYEDMEIGGIGRDDLDFVFGPTGWAFFKSGLIKSMGLIYSVLMVEVKTP